MSTNYGKSSSSAPNPSSSNNTYTGDPNQQFSSEHTYNRVMNAQPPPRTLYVVQDSTKTNDYSLGSEHPPPHSIFGAQQQRQFDHSHIQNQMWPQQQKQFTATSHSHDHQSVNVTSHIQPHFNPNTVTNTINNTINKNNTTNMNPTNINMNTTNNNITSASTSQRDSTTPHRASTTPQFQLNEFVLVNGRQFHEDYPWWAAYIEELPSAESNKKYKIRFLGSLEYAFMQESHIRKYDINKAKELLHRPYPDDDIELHRTVLRGLRLSIQDVKAKCDYCGKEGTLLLCDGYECSRICHAECLPKVYDQSLVQGSEELWLCNDCEDRWHYYKLPPTQFTPQTFRKKRNDLKKFKEWIKLMIKELEGHKEARNFRSRASQAPPHPHESVVTRHIEEQLRFIRSMSDFIDKSPRSIGEPTEEDFVKLCKFEKTIYDYQYLGLAALVLEPKPKLPNAPPPSERAKPRFDIMMDQSSRKRRIMYSSEDEEEEPAAKKRRIDDEDDVFDVHAVVEEEEQEESEESDDEDSEDDERPSSKRASKPKPRTQQYRPQPKPQAATKPRPQQKPPQQQRLPQQKTNLGSSILLPTMKPSQSQMHKPSTSNASNVRSFADSQHRHPSQPPSSIVQPSMDTYSQQQQQQTHMGQPPPFIPSGGSSTPQTSMPYAPPNQQSAQQTHNQPFLLPPPEFSNSSKKNTAPFMNHYQGFHGR